MPRRSPRRAPSSWRCTASARRRALRAPPVVGEAVPDTAIADGRESAALVDALAEACDREPARDLLELLAVDVRDEEPGRVRPEIDRRDARHRLGRNTRSHRVRRCAASSEPSSTCSCARDTRSRSARAWRSPLARRPLRGAARCGRPAPRTGRAPRDRASVRLPCLHSVTPRTITTKRPTSPSTSPTRNAVRTTLESRAAVLRTP
jgi:hypothetical protein